MIGNEKSGGNRSITATGETPLETRAAVEGSPRGIGETPLETCAGVEGSLRGMGETPLGMCAGVDGSLGGIAGTSVETSAVGGVGGMVPMGDSVMSTV